MKINHLQEHNGEFLTKYIKQLQKAYTTSHRIFINSIITQLSLYIVACCTNSFNRIKDIILSIWAICTAVIAMHIDSTRNERKNMKCELQSLKKMTVN